MAETKSIYPFSNGTQYEDWSSSNCERCTKGYHNNGEKMACDIENALLVACFGDGSIAPEIRDRMTVQKERYVWPCGEWVPTAAVRKAGI